MRWLRIVLILVAVVCFGVALSYPIRYRMAQDSNNSNMEQLSELRAKAQATAQTTEGMSEPAARTQAPEEKTAGDASSAPDEADSQAAEPEAEETMAGTAGAVTADEPGDTSARAADGASDLPGEAASPGEDPAVSGADAPETSGAEQPGRKADTAQGQASGESDEGDAPEAAVVDPARTPEPVAADTPAQAPESAAADTPGQAPESAAADTPGQAPESVAADGTGQASGPVAADTPAQASEPTPEPTPAPTPGLMDLILGIPQTPQPLLMATGNTGSAQDGDSLRITPEPSPTPNRRVHTGALPYPMKEKVELDLDAMLPELREIYDLNHDLVGWLTIPDTVIDYPVVQTEDSDFYLSHDFYGEENVNGQIILDTLCDPYTPSYNLVISGHHMKNGSMFGDLPKYASINYWQSHKLLEFDTLMERKQYVIFAAFYSADYDEDEEGFRYNANIQYALDAELWLAEVRENQLYDTQIDVEFGDELITLTTCNRARHRNGRFVVVCRRIREGETFE